MIKCQSEKFLQEGVPGEKGDLVVKMARKAAVLAAIKRQKALLVEQNKGCDQVREPQLKQTCPEENK